MHIFELYNFKQYSATFVIFATMCENSVHHMIYVAVTEFYPKYKKMILH